ncbi:MAG: metallophosphoesterase [Proteobacteria bacterium]|nr:metallophosphoesterase [Pseudomonadota bacterium]
MHISGRLTVFVHFLAVSALAMTLSCGGGCATTQTPDAVQSVPDAAETKPAPDVKAPVTEDAPLPDVTVEPKEDRLLRLAVIADMNGRYGSAEYDAEVVKGIDMIIEDRPDIVINAGDMVAGQKPKLDYRKMWTGFHATVTQRLLDAGILMAQTPGNHDGSAYPKYEKEREIYIDEWTRHRPALDYVDDSLYPLSYSFMLKGVFFVALDATTLDQVPDDVLAWFEGQLANNPSKYRPIVFFHVPLYPITTIKPTEILRDERIPAIMEKYHVQLVLNGHQQAYFPAKLHGITYVHAGALGGGPRPVRQNNGIAPKTLTFVNIYPTSEPYIDTHLIDGEKGEHFNHNLLPTYIVFGNKILPRADVSLEDAEFARDYMISPHMTKSQMDALIKALRANDGDWGKIPDWKADK